MAEETGELVSVHMFSPEAVDMLTRERGKCLAKNCDVRKVFMELRECSKRVHKKIKFTAETCHQEMVELMEALDHCVKDYAFSRLA